MIRTILDQYRQVWETGEGDIICPLCEQEIGQWHDEASDYLANGCCPFCDCNGIAEQECEWRERCNHCPGKKSCEEELKSEALFQKERQLELLQYQCTGGLSYAERMHTNYWN